MLGIPGSTFLESKVLGTKSFGVVDEVSSMLGLNAANSPVLLMLGEVKFSLNTAVMSEVSRSTEAVWAEAMRFGELSTLQHTGPGNDTLELPGTIYPDWKGAAGTLDTLRRMQRAGEVYMLIAANGDVLGLFVITAIKETRAVYKSNGDAQKVTFILSLRRYMEMAAQKPTPAHTGLFGGIKKFANKIGSGVQALEDEASDALNGATNSIGDGLDSATGGLMDELNNGLDSAGSAVDDATKSVTDGITKGLDL